MADDQENKVIVSAEPVELIEDDQGTGMWKYALISVKKKKKNQGRGKGKTEIYGNKQAKQLMSA